MRPVLVLSILAATGLAGCAGGDDGRVVEVDLALHNDGASPVAMKLYAVHRGTGPDGQDAWLPARIEGALDPGEQRSETELLVVHTDDLEVLRFWARAEGEGIQGTQVYRAVPAHCVDQDTWRAMATYRDGLTVQVSCPG